MTQTIASGAHDGGMEKVAGRGLNSKLVNRISLRALRAALTPPGPPPAFVRHLPLLVFWTQGSSEESALAALRSPGLPRRFSDGRLFVVCRSSGSGGLVRFLHPATPAPPTPSLRPHQGRALTRCSIGPALAAGIKPFPRPSLSSLASCVVIGASTIPSQDTERAG
ncbi:hypothetical protein B0H19DRAFT_1373234 [Mycena capillaripes]|nr:hypothetical protein B0H19DRAFT_1373234 [Mycena capillaripes]